MRVLVTGGAGFIGSGLVRALLSAGHQVRVLDLLSAQVHGDSTANLDRLRGAEVVIGDVRDSAIVARALAGIEVVVHLAAETGVGQSMYEVDRYVSVNDLGTANLLMGISQGGGPVRRLVLASSRAVYGEGTYWCSTCGRVEPGSSRQDAAIQRWWDPPCPCCGGLIETRATDESTTARPRSVYAATKVAQEHLASTVGGAYGIETVAMRYFNVYGPGQSLNNPYTGILSTFFTRARSADPIDVYEDGRQSRDFVYVDDCVSATIRAVEAPAAALRLPAYNVGTGVPVSVLELAQLVRQLLGSSSEVRVTGGSRLGDIRHAIADTRSASRDLGFRAAVGLREGLERWTAWARRQGSVSTTPTWTAQSELAGRGLYRETTG